LLGGAVSARAQAAEIASNKQVSANEASGFRFFMAREVYGMARESKNAR
jgi:hypothetical protein